MLQVFKDLFTGYKVPSTDQLLTEVPAVSLGEYKHVTFTMTYDNGAGGNPTDSAVGVWELYVDRGDGTFVRLTSTDITTQLANMALAANTASTGTSVFDNFPMARFKIRYKRTSGGGGDSRVTLTYMIKP